MYKHSTENFHSSYLRCLHNGNLFKIFHINVWIFIIPACLVVLNMVNISPGKTNDGVIRVKVVETLR